jgi:cell division protein FtsB
MAGKDRDRFSTATRLRLLGEQTAARVYRSQTRRQARRSRLTGRAALLALVLCSLAYPMRQYVSQRSQVADLERQQEQARKRVEQLRDLKARWQDDAYAKQQIRQRLHYVMPGETGYIVIDPDAPKQSRTDRTTAARPWYTNLWDGVDKADKSGQ